MKKLCIGLGLLALWVPAPALAHGRHTHSRHHHKHHAQHYVHHHKKYRAHKADVEAEPTWLEWQEECLAEGLNPEWCYAEAAAFRWEASLMPQQIAEEEACDTEASAAWMEEWECSGPRAVGGPAGSLPPR